MTNSLLPLHRAHTPWTKPEAKHWAIVLFIGTLAAYACRVSLPICAVPVAKQYDWTKKDSGTVLSSFFWGYATTQVLGGWLADRVGGERLLAVTSVGWAFITFAFPFLIDFSYFIGWPFSALVLFRVLMGVTQGVHFPCLASMTARHLNGPEKSRMLGILMAGSHAGTVLCGSLGSIIMDFYGWSTVFCLLGLFSLSWWLYLRYLITSYPRRKLAASKSESCDDNDPDFADFVIKPIKSSISVPVLSVDGEVPAVPSKSGSSISGANGVTTVNYPTSVPWMVLFKRVPFWAAICAHYCGANAFFTLFSWMPTYFTEISPEAEGWVFNFVPNLAIVITSFISPSIAARLINEGYSVTFVRKLMEGVSQVGMAIMLFCVAAVNSYEAALFCMTLALGLRGLHHAGVAVNAQDFAPNHAGAVFGFVNTASAIPGFVGVYIAGFILDVTRSWSYVFSLTGCMCLLGASVFVLFGTGKQIV